MRVLLILGTSLFTLALTLFFHKESEPEKLLSQAIYMGPIKKIPGDPYLVKIEVHVYDSPDPSGLQIKSVMFNEESIPLKPRDIHAERGSASFQLPPGKYPLKWVVNRSKTIWPRTSTFEEIVNIDPRDLWIQISIEGDKASIH